MAYELTMIGRRQGGEAAAQALREWISQRTLTRDPTLLLEDYQGAIRAIGSQPDTRALPSEYEILNLQRDVWSVDRNDAWVHDTILNR